MAEFNRSTRPDRRAAYAAGVVAQRSGAPRDACPFTDRGRELTLRCEWLAGHWDAGTTRGPAV